MAEEKQTMWVGFEGCGCIAVHGQAPELVTSHGYDAVEMQAKEVDALYQKKSELHPKGGDFLPHESA